MSNFKVVNTLIQETHESILSTLSNSNTSGPTGATGSTGPTGATGSTGATGATGSGYNLWTLNSNVTASTDQKSLTITSTNADATTTSSFGGGTLITTASWRPSTTAGNLYVTLTDGSARISILHQNGSMYYSVNYGGGVSIGSFANGNTIMIESNPSINTVCIYKIASGSQSTLATISLTISSATLNFHEYVSGSYTISNIDFYTSGPSMFIPYTSQSFGATTPNPGTTGKFTINNTSLFVWNGSSWVEFTPLLT